MDVCAKGIKSLCLFNVLYTKILLLALYFLQGTAPLFFTHHGSVGKACCIGRTIQNSFTGRKKGVTLGQWRRHTFYGQRVGYGRVDALKCGPDDNTYLSCRVCRAHQHRGTAPLHHSRIGHDTGIADDRALAFDGECHVLACLTTHMPLVVGHLGHHDDEVRAVGYEFLAHLVGIESQLRAAPSRHFLFAANYLTVDNTFGNELYFLP